MPPSNARYLAQIVWLAKRRIQIVMACLRTTLRYESQTVGPLYSYFKSKQLITIITDKRVFLFELCEFNYFYMSFNAFFQLFVEWTCCSCLLANIFSIYCAFLKNKNFDKIPLALLFYLFIVFFPIRELQNFSIAIAILLHLSKT